MASFGKSMEAEMSGVTRRLIISVHLWLAQRFHTLINC